MKKLLLTSALTAFLGTLAAHGETKVDFAKDIQPILQQSCVKCHGAEKQKSKLRLDSREAALKGGKGGTSLVPSTADKSELYRRIILPKGDDDVMPNEGDLLTKAQTDLIRDWINQGAVWPETAVAKSAEAPATPAVKLVEFKPGEAEGAAISKLESQGISVRPIAMNVVWKEASFRSQGTNANDAMIAPLKDVATLVDLNLAGTMITDAGLAALQKLTNLMTLHLEQTKISDAALAHLKGLAQLSYLNLYGTKVTDAGLEHLKGLSHLKNLYVWQTQVTSNGVASLKTALPKIVINTGWEMTAMAKVEEKPKEPAKDKPAAAAKEPAKEPAKVPAKDAAKDATKEPAKDAVKDAVKDPAKDAVKVPTKDAVKDVKEPAKDAAKDAVKDPAKDAVDKEVKK